MRIEATDRRAFSRKDYIALVIICLVLAGLLLPKLLRIKDYSERTQSKNNLKSILLAVCSYEAAYSKLPPLMGGGSTSNSPTQDFHIAGGSLRESKIVGPLHIMILPYLEDSPLYASMATHDASGLTIPSTIFDGKPAFQYVIKSYVNPLDPSQKLGLDEKGRGVCSYAANAQLFASTNKSGLITEELTGNSNQFDRGLALDKIPDGSSHTIAFSEKFGSCGNGGSLWSAGILEKDKIYKEVPANTAKDYSSKISNESKDDRYYWPVFGLGGGASLPPAVYGANPASNPASRVIFQVQPDFQMHQGFNDQINKQGCDAFRANSTGSSQIIVGMADGSVLSLRIDIDPQIWFYAIYPDDGTNWQPESLAP
ncbi:DUF1559 domain-containing protein [Telmatocola sphagniphila]|uniref:DUF1559 domain-containing protein n=1 Tax=Telmatocola sphagniphila TaxID=1123043 RepID=A0A8E6EXB1_9BACT|nr:DUF1559 domain-containing protein [Telmatocola sphagniphila]QVL31061.1 DUF1559 domain-containing protein [Telmatocola sphagniphila]